MVLVVEDETKYIRGEEIAFFSQDQTLHSV